MNITNISSGVNIPDAISIGKRGENGVTKVIFDYTSWVDEFGEGTVQLLARRKGDDAPYPVELTDSGGVCTWLVSDSDTANEGLGEIQYVYIVDSQVAKTAVFHTIIENSIRGDTGDPPRPYESWVSDVLKAAEEVKQAMANGGYLFTDDGNGNITITKRTSEVENNG